MFAKIVIVTRRTRLEELVERFNTRAQAKFYIEHAGGDFESYVREDDTYRRALDQVRTAAEVGLKVQRVERSLVPTLVFDREDLIVTLGQDGLVANTAKYVGEQPIVAVNPDPLRFDGVLLPWSVPQTRTALQAVLESRFASRRVTLAEARFNDGQQLLAFNELFVGARTHVSARYALRCGERVEQQSSSGVIVSTGAGSTGWLSSMFNMARGIAAFAGGSSEVAVRLPWDDPRLVYVVREPFASRHSQASMVAGWLQAGGTLVVESMMPSGGVVFSDGVESDYVAFGSGSVATIGAAARRAQLVVPN